jgi:hypothetical protein
LNSNLYLLLENLLFFLAATFFLGVVGWAWKDLKPFELPRPLPGWFNLWFGTVQVLGGVLPLLALLLWGLWWGYSSVLTVLVPYLVMLGLQVFSEIVTLRQFQSVVWVMIPYLYVPYRVWQLYEGLTFLSPENELIWVRILLLVNIVVWIANYALDLAQLPRLFRWEAQEDREIGTTRS